MKRLILLTLFSNILLMSCYSFTGSSLTTEKTLWIKPFPNNSALVQPELEQAFTIALQNRFFQRTRLKGQEIDPDIYIEGEITDYRITPATISTSTDPNLPAQAAQSRLSISVQVRYRNKVDKNLNFSRLYTDEILFNNDNSTVNISLSQLNQINDRIINKIFNDIVANW